MISKKDRINVLLKHLESSFFDKGLFSTNNLKDLNPELLVKTIKGIGEYTYGYDQNGLGYYFIFIDLNKEGFVWLRTSFKENGAYNTFERIISTPFYKDKVEKLYELTNLNDIRELHLEKIRGIDISFTDISLKRIISDITFSNYSNRVNKLTKFKVLGLIFISEIISLKENSFNRKKVCSTYTENLIMNRMNRMNLTNSYLIGSFIIDNIEYIVNNRINLKEAIKKFKENPIFGTNEFNSK